jgi:predicted Rossmann fold flavoprotein
VIDFDVLIIGAGAAGMMCAIEAGRRGRRTVLIEHQERIGKKIAISGGGRCNFTNLYTSPANYLSAQPDFCKSALARYTPQDFVALVEQHGIAYHEKKLGQQFCDGSSRQIIEMMLTECAAAGVDVRVGCHVSEVQKAERFVVITNQDEFRAQSLVVATGGLSFPKLGANDFGYRLARQFGLGITELRPALVPLTFAVDDHAPFHELSGVSVPVIARHRGAEFAENLLFTHRGVSGPAVLQISSYWRDRETLHFNLLPDLRIREWLAVARREGANLVSSLSRHWPRRFAEIWCARHAPAKPLAQWNAGELASLAEHLENWPMRFAGTEGYAKAEVTLGGVDTRELSSKTMETRRVPGLYFIGEVVDVTGWLGGYNFQWAWASGHAAGQFV